jgi:DNA polymerase I-like protein with 3'-5' exonuclease and polymerase domains
MIAQHSLFAALPKSLAFIASMYARHYVYWKDEGKNWDPKMGEDQLWSYNCQDCVYTRESGEVLMQTAQTLGLAKVDSVQQRLFWPVLKAMQTGIRILPEARNKLTNEIQDELAAREGFLYAALGHSINVGSPLQMQKLFYEDLQQKPVLKRVKIPGGFVLRPTVDDDALQKIGNREPLIRPITHAIADIRTLNKWLKDFVLMRTDSDGRMRCSFNVAGDAQAKSAPYTYRLSSSENAFGSGGNLQTIPSEKSKSAGKAAARGSMEFDLPNIRSMFGPDLGFTFFDMDLDRADLHVFVWEIEDELYKELLRKGVDAHLFHVYLLDDKEPPPLDELVEGHPKYPDHRGPRKHKREFSKVFCHATDYVGSAKTVAEHTNRTIHEVDKARRKYLSAHPKIEPYWESVKQQLQKRRYVENKFGYRWYVFDRLADLLPEVVAWIPQSTVGCTINRTWLNLHDHLPEVQTLLQVHDSLAGQFPTHLRDWCIKRIREEAQIVIPYDDPLIIPVGIKTSEKSWGECA